MTKLKQQYKLYASLGVIVLLVVVAIGVGVGKAYQSDTPATTVIENAGGVTINNPAQEVEQGEELGSMSSPNIVSRWISVNGDTTYHMGGPMRDATTTIVSFPSPFKIATSSASDIVIENTTNNGFGYTSATTTVDLVRLDIETGATSTLDTITCGASASAYTADSVSLLDAVTVATSTTGIIENNLTAALGGIVDAGTVEKITLTPNYPYFTCVVTTLYEGSLTETTNAFDGNFTVHLHKQR